MDLLSNPWFVTVAGGALASIIAAVLIALIMNRSPSIFSLYKKALDKLVYNKILTPGDKSICRNALKERGVKEFIETVAADPGEEAQALCQAIVSLAPSSSRLADPTYTRSVVAQWLENEQRIEGTNKYRIFHERNRDRRPYFDQPPILTGVLAKPAPGQVTLIWQLPLQADPAKIIWRYYIARSTDPTKPFTEIATVPANLGTSYSFTDKGLSDGTIYYYTLWAESKVFKRGHPSETVSATPGNEPSPALPDTTTTQDASGPLSTTGSLSSSVVPGTFFMSREYLLVEANKCVGREQYLDLLHKHFEDPNYVIILIEGFGGLGKTTLGARFAIDISSQYQVLWLNCGGIPVTEDHLLRDVGGFAQEQCNYPFLNTVLENHQISPEDKEKAFLDFLLWAGDASNNIRPLAIFFDDYHKVEDTALKQLVLRIAESRVKVKVVLTIRFLPSELQNVVDRVSSIQLEGLSPSGCRKLIETYTASYPALLYLNDEKLQRIWELTRGVPTVLKILIPLTRRLSLDDIMEELPMVTSATQKQWFDKLFNELSIEEQQVAEDASIFRRPTTRKALIYVSRVPAVKEAIVALQDRFILSFDGQRYFMHDLWTEYTRQRLSADDIQALHRRAATFYQEFESGDRQEVVMSRLESCYHYTEACDMEQVEQELTSIADTLRLWGYYQEFMKILEKLEKYATERNKPLAPRLLLEKSGVLYAYGEVEQSIASLKDLVSNSTGDLEIRAILDLGWIYLETSQWDNAEPLFEQGLQLARQLQHSDLEEEALYRLQQVCFYTCQYEKAMEYDQQRLDLLQRMESTPEVEERIAYVYHDIGNIYRERGYYDEALEYYKRYETLRMQHDTLRTREAWPLYNIGEVYRDQGKYKEAMEQFRIALQYFTKQQHLYGIAHVKIELGRVGVRLGPADAAIKEAEEALAILQKVKGGTGIAYTFGALGQIYLYLGKFDQALQYLQESYKREASLSSTKGVAWSLHQISLVYYRKGKLVHLTSNAWEEACSYFHEAKEKITEAQKLFAQIRANPNIRGIQDDAAQIEQACVECETLHKEEGSAS